MCLLFCVERLPSHLSNPPLQNPQHIPHLGHRPKNPSLSHDALNRRLLHPGPRRLGAVPHQQTVEPAITPLAHRAAHTHVRRYPLPLISPHPPPSPPALLKPVPQSLMKKGPVKNSPAKTKFRTPFSLSKFSNSVCANAPFPGLSSTTSPACGYSSGMVSWPRSPRIRRRPSGPGEPMPSADGLLRERKSSRAERVERVGGWPGVFPGPGGRGSVRSGLAFSFFFFGRGGCMRGYIYQMNCEEAGWWV